MPGIRQEENLFKQLYNRGSDQGSSCEADHHFCEKRAKGIRIRWKAQKNCDGYRIYRKIKGGNYQSIKVISQGTAATYLDKTAKKGVSYYYAVRAYVKEPYGRSYSGYKSSAAVKR
ncbi:MAG: hypothetical protein ACLUTA_14595 [Blautia wexlerae]